MKIFIAFVIAAASICGFIGLAEAGVLTDIITHLKHNAITGPGQIPWPAFMLLIAVGVIGFLGIRRRGMKS